MVVVVFYRYFQTSVNDRNGLTAVIGTGERIPYLRGQLKEF